LSLNNPQYLSVHEHHTEATPSQLVQNYIVCNLQDKLDALFSFIKTHIKSKIIVFFSTCAQVRFVHECFCGMQPGVPLTALHGKLKQERRTLIYMDFIKKKSAVMFATDLAARGLDFPDVDWVIQMDAPEDAAMYIHRVGRTARYTATGRALLMLIPSEEQVIVSMLNTAGVPIKKLTMNPKYAVSVSKHAAAMLVAQPECKQLAKKAFVGYLRSLQLMPQREIALSVGSLPVDEFATSLGLAFTPLIPTIKAPSSSNSKKSSGGAVDENDIEAIREDVREKKNINWSLDKLKKQIKAAKEEKKKLRASKASGGKAAAASSDDSDDDNDDDDELFAVKAKIDNGDDDEVVDTTAALDAFPQRNKDNKQSKLKIRGGGDLGVRVMREAGAKKIVFNDDGEVAPQLTLLNRNSKQTDHDEDDGEDETDAFDRNKAAGMSKKQIEAAAVHAQKVKSRIDAGRAEDYQRDKLRVKEKHKEEKAKLRAARGVDTDDMDAGDGDGFRAVLATGDDNDESGSDRGYSSGDNDDGGEDYDDNDSDEDLPVQKGGKNKRKPDHTNGRDGVKAKKAKKSAHDYDDDEDEDNDVAFNEQMALKMLE
jgi:ATP-dependent RNA helicase DDX10/DBP4